MPVGLLSASQREQLSRFPDDVSPGELRRYFELSADELCAVRSVRGATNRLGLALQLCALRLMGFAPDDLQSAPAQAVAFLARQVDASVGDLPAYGERAHTRTDHAALAMDVLGFRAAGETERRELAAWLLDRALEHDRPSLLFELAADRLRAGRVVRPGVTQLERLVASVRAEATAETYRRLEGLLDTRRREALDELLVDDPSLHRSRLSWLRQRAVAITPRAILGELEKLAYLRGLAVEGWDVSALSPNRVKFLAQLAYRSPVQTLARMSEWRRYPILLCFGAQAVVEITDELVDLFDRCLQGAYGRARRELDELRRSEARSTNEKVRLLVELGRILLDPAADPARKLALVDERIGSERLRAAIEDAERTARPEDDHYFDLLAARYGHLREFTPTFLAAMDFRAGAAAEPLLDAVRLLGELNARRARKVPADAELDFVPARWRPYVVTDDGQLDRRYWELCVLMELRGALRAGNLWLEHSRRYANPESYLIPPGRWPGLRGEVCAQLGAPTDGARRLDLAEAQLHERTRRLDERLVGGGGSVRVQDGGLIVPQLEAEPVDEHTQRLAGMVAERLPRVELTDLLIEVDGWVGFSAHFTHAGGGAARSPEHRTHLYAALLAQATNLGISAMADVAELSYRQLDWTTNSYLRDETLTPAITALVNYSHRLPLTQAWGDGTLSSSDGQRFPVRAKTATATALPRYFGTGRGLTFYTWTSDQFSQYGSRVISSTVRDATYVLDAILDNETELEIHEHTTDTDGYTDLVFGLFDLLGLQFAPRIRDLGAQRLYRLGPVNGYQHAGALLKTQIDRRRILERWDDLLRVAGSLKLGWVTASLLISRLQASPRQNALARALQEHGRVAKTLHVLRYLEDDEYRRRINRQLNKGESLHALRRFLFFAHEGHVRRRQHDDQADQAACLTLLTNAVVVWNTVYMAAAIGQLTNEGLIDPTDADPARLFPTLHEHINPYGKYRFAVDQELNRRRLRPLRSPGAHQGPLTTPIGAGAG